MNVNECLYMYKSSINAGKFKNNSSLIRLFFFSSFGVLKNPQKKNNLHFMFRFIQDLNFISFKHNPSLFFQKKKIKYV